MTDDRKVGATAFFPGLESLRGVAALAIAIYHISWQTHLGPMHFAPLLVDFFFVLSGFVMIHTYRSRLESLAAVRKFLTLRLGRLYPLHLATLLCWLLIELAKRAAASGGIEVAPGERTVGSFIANLLLIHALGPFNGAQWNVPSWSISAEFWAYVVFAAVCRRAVFAAACVLAFIGLAVCWSTTGDLSSIEIYAFPRCLFGFFSGVLGWRIYSTLVERKIKVAAYWPVAIAVGSAVFLISKKSGLEDFLAVPIFMLLIVFVALSNAFNQRRLVAIGTISYSIYMVHPLVMFTFEFVLQYLLKVRRDVYYQVGPFIGDGLVIVYVAVVLLVSRWTYVHIEDRFRKLVAARA